MEEENEEEDEEENLSSLMLVAQTQKEGNEADRGVAGGGGLAHDRYYHFQGLYVPAVPKSVSRFELRRGIVITASGRIPGQAIGAYVRCTFCARSWAASCPSRFTLSGPGKCLGPVCRPSFGNWGMCR